MSKNATHLIYDNLVEVGYVSPGVGDQHHIFIKCNWFDVSADPADYKFMGGYFNLDLFNTERGWKLRFKKIEPAAAKPKVTNPTITINNTPLTCEQKAKLDEICEKAGKKLAEKIIADEKKRESQLPKPKGFLSILDDCEPEPVATYKHGDPLIPSESITYDRDEENNSVKARAICTAFANGHDGVPIKLIEQQARQALHYTIYRPIFIMLDDVMHELEQLRTEKSPQRRFNQVTAAIGKVLDIMDRMRGE